MRCGRQGTCLCNDERCFDAQQWWLFCMSWLSISWAMVEQTGHKRPNKFCEYLEGLSDSDAA